MNEPKPRSEKLAAKISAGISEIRNQGAPKLARWLMSASSKASGRRNATAATDRGQSSDALTAVADSSAVVETPGPVTPRIALPPIVARLLAATLSFVTTFLGTLVFGALILAVGISSAWYAVHSGLPFNTYQVGPWVVWTHVGSLDSDPYSQARFAQMGALTTGSDRVVRFEARVDSDGRRLHSACTYELNSPPLDASYWTLGVFDTAGRLIPNDAERYGFSIASVARDARGAFRIVLARDAQPGNWVPTGTAGRMVIILQAVEGDDGGVDGSGVTGITPPTIRRTAC